MSDTIVTLKLDFAAQKNGGTAVSAVLRLGHLHCTLPIVTKEHANAHRRDALCPSPKIQMHAAFGMTRYSCAPGFLNIVARSYDKETNHADIRSGNFCRMRDSDQGMICQGYGLNEALEKMTEDGTGYAR